MHNREKVATVMQLLHGLPFPRLDGALSLESAGIQNSIQCHFLHDHVITYDDLQSTSLLIGQLPCTFNDESSLKELFSQQDVPCHFEVRIPNTSKFEFLPKPNLIPDFNITCNNILNL